MKTRLRVRAPQVMNSMARQTPAADTARILVQFSVFMQSPEGGPKKVQLGLSLHLEASSPPRVGWRYI